MMMIMMIIIIIIIIYGVCRENLSGENKISKIMFVPRRDAKEECPRFTMKNFRLLLSSERLEWA